MDSSTNVAGWEEGGVAEAVQPCRRGAARLRLTARFEPRKYFRYRLNNSRQAMLYVFLPYLTASGRVA